MFSAPFSLPEPACVEAPPNSREGLVASPSKISRGDLAVLGTWLGLPRLYRAPYVLNMHGQSKALWGGERARRVARGRRRAMRKRPLARRRRRRRRAKGMCQAMSSCRRRARRGRRRPSGPPKCPAPLPRESARARRTPLRPQRRKRHRSCRGRRSRAVGRSEPLSRRPRRAMSQVRRRCKRR